MKKKYLIILFSIITIIFLLIQAIPIPINKTVKGLEVSLSDSSYLVEHTITINGHYHFNIFQDDTLSGQITFSGYNKTQFPMEEIELTNDEYGDDTVYLEKYLFEENRYRYKHHNLGSFITSKFPYLYRIVELRNHPYETGVDSIAGSDFSEMDRYIVFDVETREEAIKIINLIKNDIYEVD
ncbi:hypothetical protein QE109_10975 [Fusibacter bizertensis]|uniref:Uncharacterized protein n=1 Tax=Fusibacter bizertensis TaxID=1488331 RepID=A0ABT6NE28_9FIRM|nr:hypothetical protein [Fusibacter bizertensis]MDH8678674.1 hypothetical protein [Fusibacter bizertensis]